MELILLFIVGALLGFLTGRTVCKPRTIGNLHIETSDPTDGPYMFLELYKGVGDISRDDYVTLKVDTENYISRD